MGKTRMSRRSRAGAVLAAFVLGVAGCSHQPSDLWLAVHEGNLNRVRELLAVGTDPNEKSLGWYPLHEAVVQGNEVIVAELIRHGANVDATIEATTCDRRQGNEWTPLHYAASLGYGQIAQILVSNNATTDVKDAWNRKPAFYAEKNGHHEIAALLQTSGVLRASVPPRTPSEASGSSIRNELRTESLPPVEGK